MQKKLLTAKAALILGCAAAVLVGLQGSALAAAPNPLPSNASALERRFEPVYDYDTDSCFPSVAIGPDGRLNGGLKNAGSITGGCRSRDHLDKDNSYSRSKCNNGWCGIIYASYFEKDQVVNGADAFGHRHDWESIVVWVNQRSNRAEYVSTSAHGGYRTYPAGQVPWLRDAGNQPTTHPQVVYHKDGGRTHAFRLAKMRNGTASEAPENGTGQWHYEDLVGWDGYPSVALRNKLASADWGSANFPIRDGGFESNLAGSKPNIPFNPRG